MDPILNYVPWVVFFPLIGLLVNLIFGRRLGKYGPGIVASLAAGLAFAVSVALAVALARDPEQVAVVHIADWIKIGALNVSWTMRVDTLSNTMMLVVSGVGTLIHVYAIGYMYFDVRHNNDIGRYARFFVFFNLFIVAMMILVTANNYLMLFVGWEGVGLCSYLLIGFWFSGGEDGIGNALAAKKAFVVNRIGDFGLLIALFLLFWNFGTFEFDTIFQMAPAIAGAAPWVIGAIAMFMLLGVTGKSAQLPLFVWLPDAMAGPTPVSALIHAATMVTAGVYLVARSNPIFLQTDFAQNAVIWVGTLTAFFAATIAIAQFDIKRVLAYSTISQLGYMVAAVGMSAYAAGMFHLITHAFFKALLFLGAGSVIQGIERGHEAQAHKGKHAHDETEAFDAQDMRNMGGLQRRMGVTFWVYLIAALAISGVAPLSGFFSKDEIISASRLVNPAVFIILIVTAFLTAFYMGRQVFIVFFGKARTKAAERATESPAVITVPLIILAVLAAVGGALNLPGIYTLEHWLEPAFNSVLSVPFELPLAILSFGIALLGLFLAWLVYGKRVSFVKGRDPLSLTLGGLFGAMREHWWVDQAYQAVIVRPYMRLAVFLATFFDQGFIDGVVNGTGEFFAVLAGGLRRFQTGFVRSYVLGIVLGVVAMLTWLVLR